MGKINVSAKQQFNAIAKKDIFVLNTEATYSTIPANEVMKEVAEKLNQPLEVIQMNMSAIKKIIESHVCNGHSVEIPYVGHLRFGFTSSAVEKASDVKKSLIKSYKLVYVPSTEIKQLLKNTRINITIYDKLGNIIGSATDTDSDVEDTAGNDQNESPSGGSGESGDNAEPAKYTMTFKFNDGSTQTAEYAAGAAISYPSNTSGYQWPASKPSVMPAQNTSVTEVAVSGGGDDDENDI